MTFTKIRVGVKCDVCGTEQSFDVDPDAFYGNSDFLAAAGWSYIEAGAKCIDVCPACSDSIVAEPGYNQAGAIQGSIS